MWRARCLRKGLGLGKDLMTAFTWCQKAVDQNHEEAKIELEIILRELEEMAMVSA